MHYTIAMACTILIIGCSKVEKHKSAGEKHVTRVTLLTEQTRRFGITAINLIVLKPEIGDIEFEGPRITGIFRYEQTDTRLVLSLADDLYPITLTMNRETGAAIYQEKNLDLSDAEQLQIEEQTNIALAFTLYREVTNTTEPKIDGDDYGRAGTLRCQMAAISFRKTRSEAIQKVGEFVDTYLAGHKECKRKYGVDVGCIWGDFMCGAVQQIDCCK